MNSPIIGAPEDGTTELVRIDDTRELTKPRRSNRSARAAGARFEKEVADYLAAILDDDRIERRVKNGAKDRGDITGLKTIRGARVVLELKNTCRVELSRWMNEATVEAANDDAAVFAVVHKRVGKGDPAQQFVTMPLHVFAALLQGGPDEAVGL